MSFYKVLENSLLEAIEMEKGNLDLKEKRGMPAATFYVAESFDDKVELREEVNRE